METAASVPPTELETRPDLFLVTNSVAFRAEEMEPKLDELAKLERWGNVVPVATTADDSYLEELIPQLAPGSTLVISGGDGTVKRTLLALRKAGFTGEEIDIIIAGAGNKNDVARMLHGKQHVSDPMAVLEHGQKTTIFPVEATMSDSDGRHLRTEEFIYNFGAGASAKVIETANSKQFRQNQQARGRIARSLADYTVGIAAALSVKSIRTDRGKLKDVMIAAGGQAAGGKIKFQLSQNSKKMGIQLSNPAEIFTARTKASIASMLGNAIGRRLGLSLSDRWSAPHDTIHVYDEAPAQADGESLEPIPAGTTVRFQRAAQGIAVLAIQQ